MLSAGETHDGTVAPGGTSYYTVHILDRTDVVIRVTEHTAEAELVYYGTDRFGDWVSSSQGEVMDVQDYFVDPGATLYFAVRDYGTAPPDGQTYKVDVLLTYNLDPIGVTMKGDIYKEAQVLEPGRPHRSTLGRDGLLYFKTIVTAGPRLRVSAELPDGAELYWADAAGGSYSSVGWTREGRLATVLVEDASAGTECYFYVTADMRGLAPGEEFTIQIEEGDK